MQKLYRSLLVAGLAAVGLAGCGDDVTIEPPPPPPPPQVRSVTVAPTGVTISVGGTVQMAAAVTADANIGAISVAWASSDAAVATVSATGLVTGVAPGSVAITATATAGGSSASGSASVTVSSTQTTPATVSIKSLTTGAGLPVVLAAAAGQINVTVNLDRGGENVQKVELLVDGVAVASQNFGSATAGVEAGEGEANAIEELGFSWNSAAFDPATGAVNHTNGNHTLSAKVTTSQNASGSVSPSIQLTLANASFIAITTQVLNGASANSATGILWQTGDLEATAVVVLYAAGSPTIQQVVLTPTGLNPKTITTSPFTATWAKGTSIASGGSRGAEAAGLVVAAASTVGGAVGPAGVSAALNFDNNGPGAPTFVANPNNRQNGWINGTVGLVGLNGLTATDNDWMVNGAADAGVGGYVRFLRIGTGGGTVANANAAAASSSPTLPAPSATNTTYCFVASARDLLDNESALPGNTTACLAPPVASFQNTGSTHLQGGVDVDAPTIAFSGGLASNARINGATFGAEFQVTVADVGAVGNSGMLSGAAVVGTVQIRNAAGTTCFIGVGAGCAAVSINAAPPFPLVPTTTVAAATNLGFATYSALAQDAAGNQSASVTRVAARDNTPATATNPAVPVTITGSFSSSAFLNDDLSIRDYFYTVGYSGLLIAPATLTLASTPTAVDAYNAATFTNTNFAINTTINTFLELQNGQGGAPAAYAAGTAALNALNLFVRDQTQAAYTAAATPIAATPPAAGVSITNFTNYAAATSNATICANTLPAGCAGVPTSTNLTAVATGTTAVFNNPFSRVDFYGSNGTDLVLLGSVPAASATLVDNGATRVWTYTFNFTGANALALMGATAGANIYAFGVNGAGNVALVSAAVVQAINP